MSNIIIQDINKLNRFQMAIMLLVYAIASIFSRKLALGIFARLDFASRLITQEKKHYAGYRKHELKNSYVQQYEDNTNINLYEI